ncbi:MAG TPA: polysaccharide deacetylase family protein [Syntrophales bacterium]|nr:polysaccharide deacetylase family protein [Syntrophales bacterium]
MNGTGPDRRGRDACSPAHVAGGVAFLAAGLLGLTPVPEAAAVPLGAFVLACLAAPFFPRSRFFLPVISRGKRVEKAVALTFDDGPDPRVTPRLLDLLERHGTPATFFVAGNRVEAFPGLVRDILARHHAVGNHSCRHDPFLMLRSRRRLREEIVRTQVLLAPFGVRPLAFRPPVGITSPRLPGVLTSLGMDCVTFSCRGGDFGNRRVGGLAQRILKRVHPGAIVLLHDVVPSGAAGIPGWFDEVEAILTGLEARGYRVHPLAELIGRPVMERRPPSDRDFS